MLQPDLSSGLICGFSVDAGGAVLPVAWQDMAGRTADPGLSVWLHFNLADGRARRFIGDCAAIPPFARTFLLDPHGSRVRIEPIGAAIVGVLSDITLDAPDDVTETAFMRFFCSERLVVTVRTTPLQTLDRLRVAIEAGGVFTRPTDILVQLLQQFELTFTGRIAHLEQRLDGVEDAILLYDFGESGGELGRLRRDLAHLRRNINPQRQALAVALPKLPPWVEGATVARLREVTESLGAHGQELEHLQESARLLQDELACRLAETTNRNLYILSIATVIFLPMTLITGIFGMNVGGIPWAEELGGFWTVTIGLSGVGLAVLLALKLRRLI